MGVLDRGERGDDNGTGLKEGGGIETSTTVLPLCDARSFALIYLPSHVNAVEQSSPAYPTPQVHIPVWVVLHLPWALQSLGHVCNSQNVPANPSSQAHFNSTQAP